MYYKCTFIVDGFQCFSNEKVHSSLVLCIVAAFVRRCFTLLRLSSVPLQSEQVHHLLSINLFNFRSGDSKNYALIKSLMKITSRVH